MLAQQCEVWHCLPDAGGLYDQDVVVVQVLAAYSAAQSELAENERKKAESRASRR